MRLALSTRLRTCAYEELLVDRIPVYSHLPSCKPVGEMLNIVRASPFFDGMPYAGVNKVREFSGDHGARIAKVPKPLRHQNISSTEIGCQFGCVVDMVRNLLKHAVVCRAIDIVWRRTRIGAAVPKTHICPILRKAQDFLNLHNIDHVPRRPGTKPNDPVADGRTGSNLGLAYREGTVPVERSWGDA